MRAAAAANSKAAANSNLRAAPTPAGADTADGVLAAVRAIAIGQVAPIADRIDRAGHYPAAALRALGEAGAYAAHLGAHTPLGARRLGVAVDAMAAVAEHCMSTAFCMWCQDAAGWYLEHSPNAALRDRLQGGIALGALMGGTGLSNPLKSLSGVEEFKLRGRRVAGGYEVSGILPWVSNLGDGHWFGTVFEVPGASVHRVMAMVRCGQTGVEIRQNAHFIALEGTGTFAVLFRRAFVADDALLADPLGDMVRRIRPGFMLLQTGMGLGVVQACIDLMRQYDTTHAEANRYLPRRADDFASELAALHATIATLVETPTEPGGDYLRAVIDARLRTSELTLAAGQAALMHAGARGYLHGSPVDRRLREGYFVAIITPSIRHLRRELALAGRN